MPVPPAFGLPSAPRRSAPRLRFGQITSSAAVCAGLHFVQNFTRKAMRPRTTPVNYVVSPPGSIHPIKVPKPAAPVVQDFTNTIPTSTAAVRYFRPPLLALSSALNTPLPRAPQASASGSCCLRRAHPLRLRYPSLPHRKQTPLCAGLHKRCHANGFASI
jgi:hypothetical protein